ncbi:NADPH-dependent diflavin oxidoreductase [Chloropicon primus]|uniref:NADPH-dependent diflavin oxidoreductase n=2 Tax=Chloropicon primus TaxID=1764295 RepID=A0A5B8MY58_9CHLO|nr:NADPH-dependent diflavin oxidoreductase [Chloropicon primus]UPR04730.1 NADPH-dependent diflavin oxidoreductase [Chloropicon primus]|eukprot:QDZ25533.1 NADPH-dependent diflavin oxidoreductase [Chloropicon primus]
MSASPSASASASVPASASWEALVLYGSQTGNAEEVAEDLWRLLERHRFTGKLGLRKVSLHAMDEFDIATLPLCRLVFFVTSTTGQGDVPENMKRFWRNLLRKSLPLRTSLNGMKYGVFGLGDSSYPKYNVAARKLFKRLEDLGGKPLVELRDSLGDEQDAGGGYFVALDKWTDALLSKLEQVCGPGNAAVGVDRSSDGVQDRLMDQCRLVTSRVDHPVLARRLESFDVVRESELCFSALREGLSCKCLGGSTGEGGGGWSRERPCFAEVTANERLTSTSNAQDVRSIRFQLDPGMDFCPGDSLAVVPSQRRDLMDVFFERIGYRYDDWIVLGCNNACGEAVDSGSPPHDRAIHLGTLFNYCLDATSATPRSYFFHVASTFTPPSDELEREKLQELSSREGRDELYQYCTRERRSLLECLQDFPSVDMPLAWIIQLCPKLQPRHFSISSACARESGRRAKDCELTVAVVHFKTPWKRSISGLCSTFLRDTEANGRNARVPVWIERGSLSLGIIPGSAPGADGRRKGHNNCAILIGPGTGIAPFKSVVDHLVNVQREVGEETRLLVFFGCRSKEMDYLHREFWETCVQGSTMFAAPGGFVTAFSRDQFGEKRTNDGGGGVETTKIARAAGPPLPEYSTMNKFYVQDAIDACSKEFFDMLHLRSATIHVAGSTGQMPKDVRAAVVNVMVKHNHMLHNQAEEYVKRLESTKRYQVEAWS